MSSEDRPRNQLLASLPPLDWEAINKCLTRVELVARTIVFDVDRPIRQVYFPENCVISIVGIMADGSAIETATVGGEGMVGLPVFLGTDRTTAQAFAQVGGAALVLGADDFLRAVRESDAFRENLQHYTQAFLMQVSQGGACNRAHSMVQRCARWLLHTRDRVGSDEFLLTRQFLSQMLGVRGPTVTETMLALQRSGAVSYELDKVTVSNKQALVAHACECYTLIAREFDRLLGTSWAPTDVSPLAGLTTSDRGMSTAGDGDGGTDEMLDS